MTEVQGSSRIPDIASVVGSDQFKGPTGPTGSAGNTGPASSGNTGLPGIGILNVQGVSSDTVIFTLGRRYGTNFLDVSQYELAGVQGSSGNSSIPNFIIGLTGITDNSYYVNDFTNGFTLYFKRIELSGNITGEYSNSNLVIKSTSTVAGGDLTPNTLLYIGLTFGGDSYFNVVSAEGAIYNESTYSALTYSNLEIILDSFIEKGTTSNFNYFSLEGQNTPIDINAGYYGLSLSGNSIFTSGHKNYLKYNVNYYNVDGNSAYTSDTIFFDDTKNYLAKIGTTTFEPLNERIGSCCYCDNLGNRKCIDYANKYYCTSMLRGKWSASPCYQRYNSEDCYQEGACCVNGRCVGTSKEKCDMMGGFFVIGENCSTIGVCPDRCRVPIGCCCYKGKSYSLTQELCAEIEGSRFFNSPCTAIDCCRVGYVGACCKKKECFDDFTASECAATGGIFQGPGTACISQFLNCCTEPADAQPIDFNTIIAPPGPDPNQYCVKDFIGTYFTTLILTENGKVYNVSNVGWTQPPANLPNVTHIAAGRSAFCVATEPTTGLPNGGIICWGSSNDVVARNDFIVSLPDKVEEMVISTSDAYNLTIGAARLKNKNVVFWPDAPNNQSSWTNIKKIVPFSNAIFGLKTNGGLICTSSPGSALIPACTALIPESESIVDMWSGGGVFYSNDNLIVKYNNGIYKKCKLIPQQFGNYIWECTEENVPQNGIKYSTAGSNIFALYSDGRVECVASNYGSNLCPGIPSNLEPFKNISGGAFHVIVQRNNDNLIAWGNNSWGQSNVADYYEQMLCENQD